MMMTQDEKIKKLREILQRRKNRMFYFKKWTASEELIINDYIPLWIIYILIKLKIIKGKKYIKTNNKFS